MAALKLPSAKCVWSGSLAAPSNWLLPIAEHSEPAHSQWQSLHLSCLHVLLFLRSISCAASDPIRKITAGCFLFTVCPLCHLHSPPKLAAACTGGEGCAVGMGRVCSSYFSLPFHANPSLGLSGKKGMVFEMYTLQLLPFFPLLLVLIARLKIGWLE